MPDEPAKPAHLDIPHDHHCAACGYHMGPAGGRTCPECGRVQTDEDVGEALRRRVYLEATLISTVATHLALPIIAMAPSGVALFTAVYAFVATMHVGIMAAIAGRAGSRATADRVMHMATLRSALVLHAPMLVGVAALEFMERQRWAFAFGNPRQNSLALPDVIGVGAPLLVVLGLALCRLAARRSYRIAGVTELAKERNTPAARRGWIYPPLLVSGFIAIGYVLNLATR